MEAVNPSVNEFESSFMPDGCTWEYMLALVLRVNPFRHYVPVNKSEFRNDKGG